MAKKTMMRVTSDVTEWLASLKVHPNQSYNEVLKKLKDSKVKL
jgi:hypothetical protein